MLRIGRLQRGAATRGPGGISQVSAQAEEAWGSGAAGRAQRRQEGPVYKGRGQVRSEGLQAIGTGK